LRLPALLVIAGPTATGKTELSLVVADAMAREGIPVEIISADSRQVYRGMDIGTAKVTAEVRARVTHHGLDLVDPDQPFTVADFAAHARAALAGLAARDGLALLAGGTGLYLRAVGRGLATDELPHDPELRASIEADLAREGLEMVATRLEELAPALAARTDLQNPRRVSRALEVAALRGDAPLPPLLGYPAPSAWLKLDIPTDEHRDRIAARARAQFESGLIDESDALRRRFDPSLRAFSAIGYREAFAVLEGTMTVAEAIEVDAARNVAFARRQRTWFRAEPGIDWRAPDEAPAAATASARRLLENA
jgi:tRNA dimethylallyltransferase